jgi:DNA-binding transcriptional LysR family regulator
MRRPVVAGTSSRKAKSHRGETCWRTNHNTAAAAVPTAWNFERDGKEEVISLEPHFSTNENEGSIAAAVAGFGITSTSGWACSRELEDGSLVRLFLGWKMVGIPVHAYFPMGSATRAAGRSAVDHLVAEFRRGADVVSP